MYRSHLLTDFSVHWTSIRRAACFCHRTWLWCPVVWPCQWACPCAGGNTTVGQNRRVPDEVWALQVANNTKEFSISYIYIFIYPILTVHTDKQFWFVIHWDHWTIVQLGWLWLRFLQLRAGRGALRRVRTYKGANWGTSAKVKSEGKL